MNQLASFAAGSPGFGFGAVPAQEFDALQKAIGAGYDVGGTTQTGGGAWRLEFLESTLAVLTETMRQVTFFRDLPKPNARSTAIEYARRTDVGSRHGGFYRAGELPLSHDAAYDRNVALVKFLGDVREIEMPFLYTDTLVEKRAEVTDTGTMWLVGQLERALFKGNAKLGVNGAEFEEIDGLETFVERDAWADSVINLWGEPLEEGHLKQAGQVVIDARGVANRMYGSNKVIEDFASSYRLQQKYEGNNAGMVVGSRIDRIETAGGTYIPRTLYLYSGLTKEQPVPSAPDNAPSPAPTVTIALTAATAEWGKSLGLTAKGTGSSASVEYQVSYGNRYGEGVPVTSTPASQAITYAQRETQNVRVTITNPAAFTNQPTYAAIYRKDTDADGNESDWGCVARVSLANVTPGGTTTWDDNGENMPGTERCWLGELSENVLHLSQLLPFTRIGLANISLSERFALVMFISFVCRIPNRWVEFRNVGYRTP